MTRTRTPILAILTVGLLAGACRSGSSTDPDAVRMAADKVCSAAQTRIDKLDRPGSDPQDLATWARAAARLTRKAAADVVALRPTSPAATKVSADLKALATLLTDLGDEVQDGQDASAAMAAARSKTLAIGVAAREAGFAACGRPIALPPLPDDPATSNGSSGTGAGAGDGNSADTSVDEAFVNQSDELCRTARQRLDDVPAPTDEQSISTFLNEVYDIIDGLGRNLSKVDAPTGAEISFREMLSSLALEAKAFDDARQAHGQGDVDNRDQELQRAGNHQDDFGAKARGIGLDECAKFAD